VPPARWKDLCLDAIDPLAVGRFWAAVLDLDLTERPDGVVRLAGATPERTVWVNPVPEPKVAKNRVHLDLVRPDVAPLLAHGARVLARHQAHGHRWVVLGDPEDAELCVFTDEPDAPTALVVDSAEPVALARWWAEALGARVVPAPDGELRWLADVPGLPFDRLKFVPTDDPRTVKNRVHWDVDGDAEALVALGARVLRRPDARIGWHVLADPEGNELCAFAP